MIKPKYLNNFLNGNIGDNDNLYEYSKLSIEDKQLLQSEVQKLLKPELRELLLNNINDLYEREIYSNLGVHSTKHIEDVMLFSIIIGDNIGLNQNTLNLLIEASKYHDTGRVEDYDTQKVYYLNGKDHGDIHGSLSASKSLEDLKDKYNKEDLSLIATAIEYHAVIGDNIDVLKEICNKYEIDTNNIKIMDKVIKLAYSLKDADALDRARFLYTSNGFVNPKYLRYDISKSLIKVSEQINEGYALNDLNELCLNRPDLEPKINQKLEETNNPKEVIRLYRHGYLVSSNNLKL